MGEDFFSFVLDYWDKPQALRSLLSFDSIRFSILMVFGVSTNPLLTSNKNNILVSNLIAVTIIL